MNNSNDNKDPFKMYLESQHTINTELVNCVRDLQAVIVSQFAQIEELKTRVHDLEFQNKLHHGRMLQ